MKILVLNSGSSSIKCSLYNFPTLIWEEKIESNDLRKLKIPSHPIDCIGHRIVHGGKKYRESTLITPRVKKEIRALSALAPLHNLLDLKGIAYLEKLYPNIPQVAVFDTAFHHTIPLPSAIYPGPYKWFTAGIQRYGFHGISFQYCTRRAEEILKKNPGKMVICHLGSGASLCAIQNGKSIDTTMGFTPLEGLMMDTRSGTIDPGLLLHLLKKKSVKTLTKELYEQSGLLGIYGKSSDMRDVLAAAKKNKRAQLALDIYIHRLSTSIASMAASLKGLDTLVFTGGIGENAPLIREKVCHQLAFLGLHLTDRHKEGILSFPHSKVDILLIHTQEAFEIATECWKKLKDR